MENEEINEEIEEYDPFEEGDIKKWELENNENV